MSASNSILATPLATTPTAFRQLLIFVLFYHIYGSVLSCVRLRWGLVINSVQFKMGERDVEMQDAVPSSSNTSVKPEKKRFEVKKVSEKMISTLV